MKNQAADLSPYAVQYIYIYICRGLGLPPLSTDVAETVLSGSVLPTLSKIIRPDLPKYSAALIKKKLGPLFGKMTFFLSFKKKSKLDPFLNHFR
jgi:hypothetical protein